MPKYPGHLLYQIRLSLPRPIWANYSTRRTDYEIVTLKDMTAMINHALKKRGFTKKLPWRTYERWEGTTFPEWYRMGAEWINEDIKLIIPKANDFRLLTAGEYKSAPMLERVISLQDRLDNVEIDKALI